MTDVQTQLTEIKTQLRPFMNGVVSHSLRAKGLRYHLILGVELPRLKELAAGYEKNHELAQALWKEDVREYKILAGLLQPVDSFYPEIADIWVEQMHDCELADYICMNLFQHLPFASEKAFCWMPKEEGLYAYCAFRLMAHLIPRCGSLNERSENEFLDQSLAALQGTDTVLCQVAQTAVVRYIASGEAPKAKVRQLFQSVATEQPAVQSLLEECNY